LVRGALGRVAIIRPVWGDECGGLARKNRATIWIDGR